ncbi:JAB domain-containing protein [Blautia sp. MCC283]|uniref:JAB domain-containing protein n=1 Tax=Blautia sp. MCC283 TaxID=2592640 RepID=UPI001C02E79D|nr:JAB domain-containing protein [Blautia sp. MCC283]MBT9841460.1 DNA repair protein RadC [Blautia sp. MCC283]
MYKIETYLDPDRLPVIEKNLICEEKIQANSPEKIYEMLNRYFRLGYRTEEYIYMVALDTKSNILGVFELSHGSVNSSICNNREIFMKALICGASGIILAHNHPSGDVTPSEQDISTARNVAKAGKMIGADLIDNLICSDTTYFSFKEKNML